jgi:hypothetical protein
MICIVYEIGGSFIDDLAFMILATPIFYPAVLKLGFNPPLREAAFDVSFLRGYDLKTWAEILELTDR